MSRSQVQTAGGGYSGTSIGNQVGERLYAYMGQVTRDPISMFQFIYRLSTKWMWMLQAPSDLANSAGIIYTIEH